MTTATAPSTTNPRVARALRLTLRYLPLVTLFAVLGLLVVYPLGILTYATITDVPPRPGAAQASFTLQNYQAILQPTNLVALRNSVVVSLVATGLALGIGGGLAWLVARTDVPLRPLIRLAGSTPLFIAALIGALAWSLLASPRSGYINMMLRDLGIDWVIDVQSMWGIIFVQALYYAPYAFLLMQGAFSLVNPDFEEAAEVHGADKRTTMRTVAFPLVKPAIFGASVLLFALIIENFSVPQILGTAAGIDLLPSRIYRLMNAAPINPNQASVIGVLLMAVVAVIMYIQRVRLSKQSFVSVTGKGFRPKRVSLGPWRWPAAIAAGIYWLLAVGLPAFALLQGSMRAHSFVPDTAALFDLSALSIDRFGSLLAEPQLRKGLNNSLILGVATASLGGLLYLVSAYTTVRSRLRGVRFIEYLATVPVAMPALVLSMGILWTWIRIPLPVFGTVLILIVAYTVRFMPQGFQGFASTIQQIDPDLEHAAEILGASRIRALWTVTVPLIRTGVIGTSLLIFVLSVRELTTSIFLVSTDSVTLAVVLFQRWEHGRWGDVAAISVMYSVLLLVITTFANRWTNQDRRTNGDRSRARSRSKEEIL